MMAQGSLCYVLLSLDNSNTWKTLCTFQIAGSLGLKMTGEIMLVTVNGSYHFGASFING